MVDEQNDQDRALAAIAAGSAIVFASTVVFVVVTQTLGPILGFEVGRPSETVLLTMIASVTTSGGALTVRRLVRRRNGDA